MGTANENATVLHGSVSMTVHPYALSWQFETTHGWKLTGWMSEETLRVAKCFFCPEAELSAAVRDLVEWDPYRLSEWLAFGRIAADDGLCSRPLPSLTPQELAPPLQHKDPNVRQRTITALGRLPTPSDRQRKR